jgi:Flp pilus assembly protein TadG
MAAATTTGIAPVTVRPMSARCGPVPSRRRSLGLSSPGGRAVGDERGAVAAELVIATPLLLLLIMGVIQFALWQHATHVAEAAAQQALSVGRLQGETPAAGEAQADAVLAQVGAGVLTDPRVTATKTAAVTTVVVTGRATSVVGLFNLPVRAVASGPSEVLTTPGQGP